MVDTKNHPTAVRLRTLRERMGYPKPGAFAKMLGIAIQRWSNVEGGTPISHPLATILRDKIPGISYDWIYTGDPKYLGDKIKIILAGVQVAAKLLKGMPLGPHYYKDSNNNGDHAPAPDKLGTKRKTS